MIGEFLTGAQKLTDSELNLLHSAHSGVVGNCCLCIFHHNSRNHSNWGGEYTLYLRAFWATDVWKSHRWLLSWLVGPDPWTLWPATPDCMEPKTEKTRKRTGQKSTCSEDTVRII